ncbi:hypothetical protein OSB04_021402 [Centaurea solstitialis]|uniref:C2H2-type domain-containing protein n=1 Tax=Centaurea solstitialis TaxID=347529 RepID=A0AA38SVR8_9ASTR|nr:hypothetical protein OSB04_021402 [Centaurea solstitialis]
MGFRRNPLDLNNVPEDFPRDHDKQPLNHSFPSASGYRCRKKKNGGKDESRKVYECRFCSLTFCKSQALGGHMNRHRQERETETLDKARKLVFGNDNRYQQGSQPIVHGGYHHQAVYPTRLFSGTSIPVLPPPPPPSPPSPTHPHVFTRPPYSSLHHKSDSEKDYFMGHVCTINPQFIFQNLSSSATPPPNDTTNYTCIGAPIGQMFTRNSGGGGDRDISLPAINRSYHKNGF